MMMRINASILLVAVLLFGAPELTAQSATTSKEARDLCKKAERLLQSGSANFGQAEKILEEALALDPNDAGVNMAMGRCQLNGPQRHRAVEYLLQAHKADASIPHVTFMAAYALQLNARWKEAIALYEEHLLSFPEADMDPMFNLADKHIIECRNGVLAMGSPATARVSNLGDGINSSFADYGPLINADGTAMYFTSRRPVTAEDKINKVTADHYEDIYSSTNSNGLWTSAQRMITPINTPQNDACVGLSNDGRTMVIYRDEKGGGDLYESKRENGIWSEPVAFGPNINTGSHESSACYSFDHQWLYFVSDRDDDNLGGQDIFRSPWNDALKQWGSPENLGPSVNTEFDEDGIFVHPDGRTIYFSSKGHNSIGGYDIFQSRLENNAWSTPVNLGWPINSPDDDLFFVRTADGSQGFFSSYRPGGSGEDDLYMVQFKNGDETVSANGGAMPAGEASGTIMLKGKITSEARINGLSAIIEMVDLQTAKHVLDVTTDGSTGDFLLAIPAGRDYAMYVKAEGYLPHSKNVSIPKGMQPNDMSLDIILEPMVAGNKVTLHNIFFETNSAILEQQSLPELNQLYYLLEMHHDLRLMIEGHTDNTGTTALNADLSAERAASVRDHLMKRGIKADRLEAVGSGDSKPLAPNTNSANRAKNRRTEIKVL